MDLDIRMVVIDTLVDCIGGANSNNRDDMAKVVAAPTIGPRPDNILVVSIHHNIKGNDGTAKQAAAGAGTLTQKSRTVVAFDIDGRPVRSVVAAPLLPVAEDQGARRPPVVRIQVLVQDHDDGRRHHRESSLCDRGAAVRREHRRVCGPNAGRDAEPPMDADEKSEIAAELYGYILDHGKHMFTADVQKWADGRGWDGQESSQGVPEAGVAQTKQRCPHPRSILYLTDIDLYKGREGQGPRTGGAAVGHTRKVWKLWQV